MGKADGLSRRVDWKVGVDKDNENQVFIKDNWIRSMYEVVVEELEVDLLEKTRSKNEDVIRVVEEMKKTGVQELRGNEWKIEEDLVLKEGKVYVLKDEELRIEVIQLHHDVPAVGHGGRWKTVELVAGSDKRCRKIHGRVQSMSENEKQDRGTSRKAEVK